MDLHSLALPLAYLGALLSFAMVVPQLVRTIRHPDLPGVSPSSWAITAIACLSWLIYGLRADVLPQVPGNVLLIIGSVALVLLVPSAWSKRRRAVLLGAIGLVIVVASLVIAPVAVGYLAFGIGLFAGWPQLVDSFENWRSGIESGVSLPTWWVKLAATASWLAYSVITMDLPVLIASVLGAATIIAVFMLEASARQAASRSLAPELVPV